MYLFSNGNRLVAKFQTRPKMRVTATHGKTSSELLLCKIFAKYSTHSGFRCLWVCVSVVLCVVVCLCLSCVCNNFRVYSIAKRLLPGFSPHLARTFLASIPSFLLFLGSFRKTRWPPCLFFYFIFSH